jgi:hypothetical protein
MALARQSHASSLDDHPLISTPIELLKNHLSFHVIDPGSMVRHAGYNFTVAKFDRDLNRCTRRRVSAGVIQKVYEHFGNAVHMHSDQE